MFGAERACCANEALLALASLPLMGPIRLHAVLDAWGAEEAWSILCHPGRSLGPVGVPPAAETAWRQQARSIRPADLAAAHADAGIAVAAKGGAGFPSRLTNDPEPPAVLFCKGNDEVLDAPTVGIVGTRRCTRYGRDVAFELGCVLGGAGVTVVSGLALGIDAAAHAGVLQASGSPVGVVASGLDVVYPRANAGLWAEVTRTGMIASEHPLGVESKRWMFPARNRIIAGLSDVVVVVESPQNGGSMYTVDAALERDIPVFAVPGPVRSPMSAGTNRLLADGALPMCDPADVLEALGLSGATSDRFRRPGAQPSASSDTSLRIDAKAILTAFAWQPRTVEDLADVTQLNAAQVAAELQFLVAAGQVAQHGAWFERTVNGTR